MRPGLLVWSLFWALVILGLPLIQGGTTYIPVTGLRLVVLVMTCVFLVSIARPGDAVVITSRFDVPVFLFWLLAGASIFITPYQYITVYWYINIIIYIAIFYLGLNSFGREDGGMRLISTAVFILVFTGAFEGAFGTARFFIEGQPRAVGTFFNPAFYAGYLIGISPLALSLLVFPSTDGASSRKGRATKLLLLAALALMILGMVYSGSRAVVAAAAGMGLVLFSRWRRLAPVILVVFVAGAVLIPNPLRERFASLKQKDIFAWERVNIWKSSVDMIADQPWGVGLGAYKYRYYPYMRPIENSRFAKFIRHADTAHSEALHISAEMSPLGTLLLAAIAVVLILAGFLESIRSPPSGRPLLAGLAGSLAGIGFHSCFDSNLHNPSIAVTAMVSGGMLSALLARSNPKWLRKTKITFKSPLVLQAATVIASLLLFGLFLYLGVTYGLYLRYTKEPEPAQTAKKLIRLSYYAPGYAPINYRLGMIGFQEYELTADIDILTDAVKQMDRAFHLNRDNYIYPLEIARGNLYLANAAGRHKRLLEMARKFAVLSLKRHPYNPFTSYLLAGIAGAGDDLDKKIYWLEKALELEPYFLSARAALVESLVEKGELGAARKELSILKDKTQAVRSELERNPAAFPSDYERRLLTLDRNYLEAIERMVEQAGP